MYLNLLILIIILVITYFLLKNSEHFTSSYQIDFDNDKKPVKLFNISSKIMGNNVNGFKLSGNDSYIEIPNMDLDLFTLSMIVYLKNSVNKQYLVSGGSLEIYIENKNIVIKHKNQKFVFDKELKSNKYIHLAFKFENKKIIIFVDGPEKVYNLNNRLNLGKLFLGSSLTKDNFMEGIIGEIKIFSDIKTNSQLCLLHDSCKLRTCSFEPNGKNRDECYQNCIDSTDNDCNEEACTNKCYNKSTSNWRPPCEFKPYGSDIFSCMNHCVTKNNCDYKNCKDICENCEDHETCPWISKKEEVEDAPEFKPVDISKLNGEPLPPKIFVTPYNGKLLINWSKPNTYEEQDGDVEEYVCLFFKTLNKSEGVQMAKVPYPKCNNCKFVINDLDMETFYSVGIRAYNKKGLSKMSNLVSMKPKYKQNIKKQSAPTQPPENIVRNEYCLNL
tara:strand:+ start:1104 stop:2432 length:1329 start_codon:yes stop_codon:yes gene_type:complete